MPESFGEWWWCPECGEPIEVCASWGDCPNSQISKSHVAAEHTLAADVCPECGGDGNNHDPKTSPLLCRSCLGSGHAAKA